MTENADAPAAPPAFTALTDLASRALGASVIAANDELFAQRENLINPWQPAFDPAEFGHKGKVYDGWETRRRRDAGSDWAMVQLGAPGRVAGVVVDTAWFRGNYPPQISVEAIRFPGYPAVAELLEARWTTLVAKSACAGDAKNYYAVEDERCWTHLRLSIYPDGGVARFRAHGQVIADPDFLTGTIDLVAAENGGTLEHTSDAFYTSPAQIIMPGRARTMGEGWENARRRGAGNDYAIFALAHPGTVRHLEVDTGYYVGNAPGAVKVSAIDSRVGEAEDERAWTDILSRRPVMPDTRHKFLAEHPMEATHVRLDVYPDGGLSRLRLWGELSEASLAAARAHWRAAGR
ncbi:MAG TPA: allantoicase [Beutenbergiaceae bacterium]|nr:allantoicase [Beutenbergiaceae bacterium]